MVGVVLKLTITLLLISAGGRDPSIIQPQYFSPAAKLLIANRYRQFNQKSDRVHTTAHSSHITGKDSNGANRAIYSGRKVPPTVISAIIVWRALIIIVSGW